MPYGLLHHLNQSVEPEVSFHSQWLPDGTALRSDADVAGIASMPDVLMMPGSDSASSAKGSAAGGLVVATMRVLRCRWDPWARRRRR